MLRSTDADINILHILTHMQILYRTILIHIRHRSKQYQRSKCHGHLQYLRIRCVYYVLGSREAVNPVVGQLPYGLVWEAEVGFVVDQCFHRLEELKLYNFGCCALLEQLCYENHYLMDDILINICKFAGENSFCHLIINILKNMEHHKKNQILKRPIFICNSSVSLIIQSIQKILFSIILNQFPLKYQSNIIKQTKMLTNILKRTTHTYLTMMKNFSIDHEWPINVIYASGPINEKTLQVIPYPCMTPNKVTTLSYKADRPQKIQHNTEKNTLILEEYEEDGVKKIKLYEEFITSITYNHQNISIDKQTPQSTLYSQEKAQP